MVLKPQVDDARNSNEVHFSFHPQVKPKAKPFVPAPKYRPFAVKHVQKQDPVIQTPRKGSSKVINTSFQRPNQASSLVEIANPKVIKYEIQVGDRLDKISDKFYGTHHKWKDLVQANPGLRPESIRPGQVIVIPNVKTDLPKQDTVYLRTHHTDRRPYKIKEKDNLSKIAERELGSVKHLTKIYALNPGLKGKVIRPGQTIYLPTSTSL